MRFSSGAEFRFAIPKYQRVWGRLLRVGFLLLMLSFCVVEPARGWLLGIAWPFILVGLVISLAGEVRERKEWEAKHQAATK